MLRLNDFECTGCGNVEEMLSMDGEVMCCPMCNAEMVKLPPKFSINMGPVGAYGYYDDNLESYVSTNKQRRELCRQKGVTPKGDTPKPQGDAWV